MKGKHRVVIYNNKLHYDFIIKRNITIIQGDSATGKTTLIDMLRQYMNLGSDSGVDVVCDVPCRILDGRDWKLILSTLSGNIIFIDEGNRFINTEEFASAVKEADNYFVLITRESLYNLPYSVEEIYGLHSSGKYQNTRRVYQEMYRIYSPETKLPVRPDRLIMEDSNSGYEFFSGVCAGKDIECISAGGKSNIFRLLKQYHDKKVCVVADGAAIGPEMAALYKQTAYNENISLYLPESFEWLILQSGIVKNKGLIEILSSPEEYIESQDYFSWEQYFTRILAQITEGSYLQYRKSSLNTAYLHEKSKMMIMAAVKGMDLS